MQRFYLSLAVLTLFSGACADLPTAPLQISTAEQAPLLDQGVAAPGTTVRALATVQLGGTSYYRESGPGIVPGNGNELGTCVSGGRWYNPQSRKMSANPHPHCLTVVPGRTLIVRFADAANYVQPRSGNVQLNFGPDVATGADRAIHYQANKDFTTGFGTSYGADNEGGAWTINFAQPLLTNTGNLLNRGGTPVLACSATHGCHPAQMTW